MKIGSTDDRAITKIRALSYGDTGIGKTTSLRTLPEDSTLIALTERGTIPLRKQKFRVVKLDSWLDIRAMVAAFISAKVAEDGSLTVELAGETLSNIKVLAIDSLSECNALCKQHILQVDRKKITGERTNGKTDSVEGVYDDQMIREDWGLLSSRMGGFMATVNQLPCHTIFTARSAWKEDKKTGEIHRTPNLNGALATECGAYFDFLMHMESHGEGDQERRVWRTFNDNVYLCKDTSAVLEAFEPADWPTLFSKVLNG